MLSYYKSLPALDQHHDQVVAGQWQEDWLLGIVTDTVTIMHYLLFLSP